MALYCCSDHILQISWETPHRVLLSRAYSQLAQFVFLFAHFRCSHTHIHVHIRNCDAPSFNVWLRLASTPTATPTACSPPPFSSPSQLTNVAHPVCSHPRLVINLPASRKSPSRLPSLPPLHSLSHSLPRCLPLYTAPPTRCSYPPHAAFSQFQF